jgi:hypothetical protein
MNQEQKKVIEGHLSPSETTKAVQTGETQLIVVTDSRMLTVSETSEAGQDTRQVNSTLLTGHTSLALVSSTQAVSPST